MTDIQSFINALKHINVLSNPIEYSGVILQKIAGLLDFKYGFVCFCTSNPINSNIIDYHTADIPCEIKRNLFNFFPSDVSEGTKHAYETRIVTNFKTNLQVKELLPYIIKYQCQQLVITPIVNQHKVTGIVVAMFSQEKKFTKASKEVVYLELFAFLMAIVHTSKNYFSELAEKTNLLNTESAERKKAEEALLKNRFQFQELIENIGEGIAILDKDGCFLFANPYLEKIFGVTAFDLTGKNLHEFISKKEYDKLHKQLVLLNKGSKLKHQVEMQAKAGELKICSITASAHFDTDGYFTGFFAIFRDITAAKWAENIQKVLYKISEATNITQNLDDLFRSIHQNLSEIINTKNFYIALFDEEAQMLSFPYFVDEFDEPPPPQKLGRGLTDYVLLTGKPLLATPEVIAQLVVKGEIKRIGALAVDWLGIPLNFDNKTFGVLVVQTYTKGFRFSEKEKNILVFVSEQIALAIANKQQAISIINQHQRMIEIQRIAKIAGWELNLNTNEAFYSENFFAVMGITDENAIRTFSPDKHLEYIYIEDRESFKNSISKENISNQTPQNCIYRVIDNTGTVKYINSSGIVKANNNGEPTKLLITIQDVTTQQQTEELKKTIAIAKHAAQVKQEFLANISHEIRTPLNAIIGFTKFLEKEIQQPKQQGYIQTILSSSNTLLVLINDILDLSKIEAGKIEIKYRPVVLSDIVCDIVKMFSLKAEEKDISIKTELDKTIPFKLFLDETRIRQIFINLVGNAVKFTEQGHVAIKLRHNINSKNTNLTELSIIVEDTGIGIAKDKQHLIFESFRQVSGKSDRKYGGTGLGLSITRRLAEIMGGDISFESEPGKGSTFKVTIPNVLIPLDEEKERVSAEYLSTDISLKDIKILFIYSLEQITEIISAFEKEIKINVSKSNMKLSNIENELAKNPDIVFIDIVNLDINQSQLLSELSKFEILKRIPLVGIVSMGKPVSFPEIYATGMDGIVRFPFNIPDLKQIIYKHIIYKNKPKQVADVDVEFDLEEVVVYIPDETMPILGEIIKKVEVELMPEFDFIVKTPKINQIKEFCTKLRKLGSVHHIDALDEYGFKLNKQASCFNIGKMKILLSYFPQLMEKIKKHNQ